MTTVNQNKMIPYMEAYRGFIDENSSEDDAKRLRNTGEEYKRIVAIRSANTLSCADWSEEEIGTGSIGERAIKAVQNNQNLIGRFQATAFADKVREDYSISERLLYDLYHDRKDEDCYERICELVGRKYDLLAYLYFILDPGRYLPLRSSIFDKVFRKIGIDLQLACNCSWGNYNDFLAVVESVRDSMRNYYDADDFDLLDAHSFLWTLSYAEFADEEKESDTDRIEDKTEVGLGAIIVHKDHGEGRIVKISDDKVYVDFNGKNLIFPYTEAFEKKYLKLR